MCTVVYTSTAATTSLQYQQNTRLTDTVSGGHESEDGSGGVSSHSRQSDVDSETVRDSEGLESDSEPRNYSGVKAAITVSTKYMFSCVTHTLKRST